MVDTAKYSQEQIDEALKLLSYHNVSELPKQTSDIKPVLYVFRHGQSKDNEDQLFSGWRDPELTQKGIEQAQVLAEKLKDKKIQMLISSPQKRAIDTMKIVMSLNKLGKDLEIQTDERLKERSYGDLQGKSKLEIQLEDPELLKSIRRSYTNIPPHGENLEMVVKRTTEFIEEIIPLMKQHKINVAISCHGNSMRGFRKYFEHLTEDQTAAIESPLAQDYASYVIA